jgi:hypothetical protein
MALFRSNRDIEFFKRLNREVIERIVGENFTYYPISKEFSETNFYGEAVNKYYDSPIDMYGLVKWNQQDITTSKFGQDMVYNLEIFLLKEYLEQIEVVPLEGDGVSYNSQMFEIISVEVPTQFLAKSGQDIGYKLTCISVRDHVFKPSISASVPARARTSPDSQNKVGVDFDDATYPYSGSV